MLDVSNKPLNSHPLIGDVCERQVVSPSAVATQMQCLERGVLVIASGC